ncbi:MAG TPA: alpha-glucuronidase family glycosyl hydrolase [Bryobacteraceae bacterium]|jgi:alpha-glucuronidase
MAVLLRAETGHDAWLRYAPVAQAPLNFPAVITSSGDSVLVRSARDEIVRGVRGMTGRTLRIETGEPTEAAIVLRADENAAVDSYSLRTTTIARQKCILIQGPGRGVLYGAFALLRKIAMGQPVASLNEHEAPWAPVRWVNHWDNLDGNIERGYGGRSIFWANGRVRDDLSVVSDYGRLLASLGINACSINNVNADRRILTPEYFPQIARIAAALRPWGVQVAISVDFGSPQAIGGLKTFDPVDPEVAAWWKSRMDALYTAVPDLAGVVMKADSEGRVGPSAYGRTHADAANVVARALAPHGGLIFYRGFVYDHHMDWNNLKLDRARAAYDNFHDLDGKFDRNVVVQIKHGPIDFQVREPASPLFGALKDTNEAVELQITQEYFGQARYTVFLVPMWKTTLDFDMMPSEPVKTLIHRHNAGGFVGVSNVGLDSNWLGNELSQANLYGFGRLAWNPNLSSDAIIDEWTRLTFGSDPKVDQSVNQIQLSSWRTFENYTGPLGLQTLTDIVGNHYSVAVEASENNGWGQWHRADGKGVGMDRTVATGTGYIGQYSPSVARMYESTATCPDDLLLFMHHVPYTHVLHDGKTVIQYLYDSHYEGASTVEGYAREWKALKGRVDDLRYEEILTQLEYQAGQAEVWRDAVVTWFWKTSGIADAKGRAGHHPGRVEAEAMELEGYSPVAIKPWESASGGTAVVCPAEKCTATTRFDGAPGWYEVRIQYFDLPAGVSKFRLSINDQEVDEWSASDHVPARKLDASASERRVIKGLALRTGDRIRIEGTPDGNERAPLDYVETLPNL